MRKIEIDKNKLLDKSLLYEYGFMIKRNKYFIEKDIDTNFKVIIEIIDNVIRTKVIDKDFDKEYLLVDTNVVGEFVSIIRDKYDTIVNDFLEKCLQYSLSYHNQVNEIISYIKNKYNDEIECLWEKSPDSGIFRNKKNNKWYAAILSVKENKIDGSSEELIFVIDLMYEKENINDIIDNKNIYRGYYMNKKSWITIKLNGSVDNLTIFKFIDISYNLSINKKKVWFLNIGSIINSVGE